MKESDFASWLEELLDLYGYYWVHFRPARVQRGGQEIYETPFTGHKGFPDYVMVRNGRLIFAEIKSEKGRVSPEQQEWIDVLNLLNRKRLRMNMMSPVEVYLWRPDDRDSIEEILK